MLSHTKFQIRETFVTPPFSSEHNEIFQGIVTHILGNNPWNIGKNLL